MIEASTLPDTPEGRLADALLAAMRSDEDDWRSFVEGHMSSAMLEHFTMEQHLEHFGNMSGDLAGAELAAYGVTPEGTQLRLERDGGQTMTVELMTVEEGGETKLGGLGVN